jgi:hypothetical protein
LPLREPEALGALLVYSQAKQASDADKNAWFETILGLLARRYADDETAVIKANDHSTALMKPMLDWRADIPMLFMYTPLGEFLSGCLKAPNRREWIRQRYQFMMAKAPGLLDVPKNLEIESDDFGKMAAMYWSYNVARFFEAYNACGNQVKSLDFNRMLDDPAGKISACGEWFKLEPLPGIKPDEEIKWLLGVYSKDANTSYSPEKRRQEINGLLTENAQHLEEAETLAQTLLGDRWVAELPNPL